jgi:hypothetical protein
MFALKSFQLKSFPRSGILPSKFLQPVRNHGSGSYPKKGKKIVRGSVDAYGYPRNEYASKYVNAHEKIIHEYEREKKIEKFIRASVYALKGMFLTSFTGLFVANTLIGT